MRILKLDAGALEWVLLNDDPSLPLYLIELSDGTRLEISEQRDQSGPSYISVSTREGTLTIYPEASNRIKFRVVDL